MKITKKQAKIALLVGLVLLGIVVISIPLIRYVLNPNFQRVLVSWVEKAGIWGMVALFLVQVFQIFIALIPGEPIEVVAGLMYGAIGGMAICIVGIILASATIFYAVRKLGKERFSRTSIYPKIMNHKLIKNQSNLDSMIFLLYLIPGTPKDMLVYVCALTNISMMKFLIISTVARIPSVITSTMAGASIMSGNTVLTVGIFVFIVVGGLIGIWYQNKRFGKKNMA